MFAVTIMLESNPYTVIRRLLSERMCLLYYGKLEMSRLLKLQQTLPIGGKEIDEATVNL